MADQLDRRRSTASQWTQNESRDEGIEDFDMFGNDFAVDGSTGVGGYQPRPISRSAGPSSTSPHRNPSRRSIALQSNNTSSPLDSLKKRPLPSNDGVPRVLSRNSFSLRHDAQYSDTPRRIPSTSSTSGMTEVSSARPFSTASRLSMHRPQSSYVGAAAPSHPYGMYPQNTTLNRQSTASTHQPSSSRSLGGVQRPTHPYGMYPQSTDDDAEETDPLNSSADIASVGFLGLNQQYARRLGPDGEEADDLIGPDGHTEQLPPYTQYPDGGAGPLPQKQRILPSIAPAGSRISHISTEVPQTANSATSMSDALLAHPAPVDGVENPSDDPSEPRDRSRRERLADKSKQRTCFGRLPVWAVVLMLTLLVIVAATIGALIGRLLPRHNGNGNGHDNRSSSNPMGVTAPPMYTTTIHDAAPLQTTASNIPPAPTGLWSLFLGTASESSSSCLDTNQAQAWQCAGPGTFLNIDIENPMWDTAQISVTTANNSKNGHGFPFQALPPSLSGTAAASLMNDTNDPEFGPALFFMSTFDKVVIMPIQANLNATDSTPSTGPAAAVPSGGPTQPSKRSSVPLSKRLSELFGRGGSNNDDDETTPAWVCFWNGTTLEGFIYVEQDSSNDTTAANSVAITTGPQSTPTAPPSKRDTDGDKDGDDWNKGNDGESDKDGNSDSHENSGNNGGGGKSWKSGNNGNGNNNNNSTSNSGGNSGHGHGHHHVHNENKGSNGSWPQNILPMYPRIVKLQERRDTSMVKPAYCQVKSLHSNGSLSDAPGDNPIVNLTESDAGSVNERVVFSPDRRDLSKRQNVADFCHCEWLSQ